MMGRSFGLLLLAACVACRKVGPTLAEAPLDASAPALAASASVPSPVRSAPTSASLPLDERRPSVVVSRFEPSEDSVDNGGLHIASTAFPAVSEDGMTVALFADIHADATYELAEGDYTAIASVSPVGPLLAHCSIQLVSARAASASSVVLVHAREEYPDQYVTALAPSKRGLLSRRVALGTAALAKHRWVAVQRPAAVPGAETLELTPGWALLQRVGSLELWGHAERPAAP